MPHRWDADIRFRRLELERSDRTCPWCSRGMHLCFHRRRRLFTMDGPLELICKSAHCPDAACPSRPGTFPPEDEGGIALPRTIIGWDVFAWIGHRRFARHWSVTQIRSELADAHDIRVSDDLIGDAVGRYQTMLAARQSDPARPAAEYADVDEVVLSIDGLQPEKGHETLYVVRELNKGRVWFAQSLLSSSAAEVRRLLEQARDWAARLGKPVRAWVTDKQDAFVTGIAEVFPGVAHRLCRNHFLRDLAKPVMEADAHAKVAMRKRVRGLREIEKGVLAERADKPAPEEPAPAETAGEVVLEYCTAVRGILNDDQGGPLDLPGLKMAEALGEVRASLQRNLDAKKGGRPKRR